MAVKSGSDSPTGHRSRRPLLSWLPFLILGALSLLLLAAAGFINGTIEWDVPWPATTREIEVFNLGRYLLWGGIAALLLAVATAFLPFRSSSRGARVAKGVLLSLAFVVLALTALVTCSSFAHSNYLHVFTS